ncbi:methylene-tetrahydromethanopterin reductase [Actinorhabdospora filicis]|uniref:Methylene-tetrahydromethanopterin reductase n=1 Tax=Actinorhabdospora filicis TaxID=1785913 RepID=A0A9W6STL3_9ACTN|nr:MsnO8 family LLM class oxidoreductase [Actinorhabdospora filicis]GLZ81602.1 methylene-tetrahydromethanopterin reductase [Actinorhabdospora filicis]
MTRISVLDRSLVREGHGAAQALRDTIVFARAVEELGYHRFWVSEHHSVPGVAGSAPTVLASAVAAATSRIRVGTGGVMLPNHNPMVVAEQFGVLESLFPGRIDMGLGRSVGFTDGVRRALGVGKDEAEAFGERLGELLSWFAGGNPAHPGVHALPAEGLRVPAFVLAINGGADIAAAHGLPLVIAAGRDGARLTDAVARYRASFTGERPYVVIAANVAVAATDAEARHMQLSEAWATVVSRTRGFFPALTPADEVAALVKTEREERMLTEAVAGNVHGTEEEVAAALGGLVRAAGADEVLVTLNTFDPAARLDSYRRLARLMPETLA